jgi:hypothetical protein
MRRCLAISAVGLAALASSVATARADEAPPAEASRRSSETIVVVSEPGDAFGLRLVAELETLGFRATIVAPTENASRASLESVARAKNAIAAIRGVASERGVEVWIADRVTGKTVLREMVRGDDGHEPDDALALRTVELFRASLLEASLPTPLRGEVPATPALRARLQVPALAPPPESPPMLRLAVAPALLFSPGGFGPAVSLTVGLGFMPSEHVGASAFIAVPIVKPSQNPSAPISLTPIVGGGAIRFALTERGARWTPTIDGGIAVIGLEANGAGATSASGINAAPYLSIGAGYAVSKNLRLRADVLAAMLASAAKIENDGQPIATWGKPIVMPSLGVDCGWF